MIKKIGVFGGTFDPIHLGHVRLIEKVKTELKLDKVIIVPNGIPPHKENIASGRHRLNMVNDAFGDFEDTLVLDYEIIKTTESYSYETISYIKNMYPQDELYFIMGMDNLSFFKEWKKPAEICKIASLVFVGRKTKSYIFDEIELIKNEYGGNITVIDFSFDCSSTEIKNDIKKGNYIFDKISLSTFRYILKNGLYQTENISEYDNYETELSKYVESKRFNHSLGVASCAYLLARKYNEDEKKAYFTGLMHDIAKRMSLNEQLKLCSDIKLREDETLYPKMLHAPAGAGVLKQKFGITDEKILNAVRLHTIGAVNMSLFDKIIYMADYIEPYRDFDGVKELRELSFKDIDSAIVKGIDATILSLIDDGLKISTDMLKIRNGLLDKHNKV